MPSIHAMLPIHALRRVSLCTLVGLLASWLGSASAQERPADDPGKPNVAIVVYDGVQIIDFTGPYEVFGQYGRNDVYTVAATTGPITTTMGMVVTPRYRFEDAPPPDVLVVPGGTIGQQREDPAFLDWVRTQSTRADYTLSVCNGAFLLAEAGVLDGLRATTFYGLLDDLTQAFPDVTVVDDQRFVDNGRIITSAGLSSGIDAALHVQERLHGRAWANAIALNMEYDWRPDTEYSRPQMADMNAPESIYEVVWPDGVLRVYEGDRDAWVQAWRLEHTATAEALAARLAEGLADGDGWARTSVEGSRSVWSFTGRDGQPWRGEVSVEAVADRGATYDVTVRVAAAGGAGGGTR